MASVSASTQTSAAPEKVWSVLSDPASYSTWIEMHQGFIGDPPTSLTPGGSFGQRLRVMGMPADVKWNVDGLEEPRRIVLKGNGPMGIALTAIYGVEPAAEGSTVTTTMEFSGAAVMMVSSQLEKEIGAALQSSLGKLKAVLDA